MHLARRPWWGGGSLRAFRRAEVIVNAVLFESRVGGVAVAMTFASIFHFEFWFLWGVGLGAFLGAFWRPLWNPKGVPWSIGGHLGVLWVTFWGLWTSFWLLWGALGVPWGSQGAPGAFLDASGGNSGRPFRSIFR